LSVTLKLATSLDGRIATAAGESRWITGHEARAAVHRLRGEHDAVVVGVETAIADDPELTVRLEGYEGRQPARVVLDSRQRLPLESRLVLTARERRVVVVSIKPARPELVAAGVQVLTVAEAANGRADIRAAVEALAAEGLVQLFAEGGGLVASSFLRLGLVDRLEWFRAPIVLGGEGRPAIGALAVDALRQAPRFRRVAIESLGDDLWERYERA
jgi:diaminohydroxyphosphoribosylaminopyrimidine deaminase/5-amino-6-(5-phosphoribosylamino)uracil reductase